MGTPLINDGEEVVIGNRILRPVPVAAKPAASNDGGGQVQITVSGATSATNEVQTSTNLSTWNTFRSLKPTDNPAVFTDQTSRTTPQRFLRTRE